MFERRGVSGKLSLDGRRSDCYSYPVIAEVGDKMMTIPEIWLWAAGLSVPLVWAAARVGGRTGSLVTFCLAGFLTAILAYAAIHESFLDGDFSPAVQQEMGSRWIAHSVTAGFLPLVLVALILGLRRPWAKRGPR
ncbi:MAG: hypothetical protein ACJAT6_000790 [Akkermansiaceae bacterium]